VAVTARYARYADNGELIAVVEAMGHIVSPVLDATWGKGVFWTDVKPDVLAGMDSHPTKARDVRGDYRRPPFRPGTWRTIVLDGDYKLNGTPTPDEDGPDERYGAHVPKTWQERQNDMLDGIAWWPPCPACAGTGDGPTDVELHAMLGYPQGPLDGWIARNGWRLVPGVCGACAGSGRGPMQGLTPLLEMGGKLLVKCMIQVSSGRVRHQPYEVMRRAEHAGLDLVDEFCFGTSPRPQPPGRAHLTAQSNYSTLLVFVKRRRPAWSSRA
jgi:hypothetical protein